MGTPQAAVLQENLLQWDPPWAVFSSGISICPGVVPHRICRGMVPSTGGGNICPGLSPPWAAGKIYTPMESLLLHLAAPLLLLTVLFPSPPIWHFLPFLKCFHRGIVSFTGGLSLDHGADWEQPPETTAHPIPCQILPVQTHAGWQAAVPKFS